MEEVRLKVPFLDLKRQYDQIKDEIKDSLQDVIESTGFIGGPYVDKFERRMEEYLDVRHVAGCSNGTDALMLGLRACGVRPGDEVITTPFTFFATAEAIAAVGAVPVFVDIRREDYDIDPGLIEPAITKKTRAILAVHIFGAPCDMDSINDIADRYGLRVIEDAAQAIGSTYKGKKAGTLGDVGCFSFYPTKNLGAAGDAGMVVTDDDDLDTLLRALREHGAGARGLAAQKILLDNSRKKKERGISAGMSVEGSAISAAETSTGAGAGATAASSAKTTTEVSVEASNVLSASSVTTSKSLEGGLYDPYKYYNYLIGYNSRLDAIQAAILLIKLKYLDAYNKRRRNIAHMYMKGLNDQIEKPHYASDIQPCFHQFVVSSRFKMELCAYLSEQGIGSGTFYPVPLHLQKAFDRTNSLVPAGHLPVTEDICDRTVCLPIYPEMTDDEVIYVIDAVNKFYEDR